MTYKYEFKYAISDDYEKARYKRVKAEQKKDLATTDPDSKRK